MKASKAKSKKKNKNKKTDIRSVRSLITKWDTKELYDFA